MQWNGAKNDVTVPRPITSRTIDAWRMNGTEQAWNS
jgi:hypothetical protein